MEITKQQLIDVINQISEKIDTLHAKLARQERQISDLKSQNEDLKNGHQATLGQIKGYIQELEKIRNHYANSNNSAG
jgi:chaperonin cofactor prefoldin